MSAYVCVYLPCEGSILFLFISKMRKANNTNEEEQTKSSILIRVPFLKKLQKNSFVWLFMAHFVGFLFRRTEMLFKDSNYLFNCLELIFFDWLYETEICTCEVYNFIQKFYFF